MKKLAQEALFTEDEMGVIVSLIREISSAVKEGEFVIEESTIDIFDSIITKLEYHIDVHESDITEGRPLQE